MLELAVVFSEKKKSAEGLANRWKRMPSRCVKSLVIELGNRVVRGADPREDGPRAWQLHYHPAMGDRLLGYMIAEKVRLAVRHPRCGGLGNLQFEPCQNGHVRRLARPEDADQ